MAEAKTRENCGGLLFGGETRDARFINEHGNDLDAVEARSGEDEAGHQGLARTLLELPEDEVAERVEDPTAPVPLDALGDVRVVTEDEGRSRIDGCTGKLLLQRAQAERVLRPLMDGDDDYIGAVTVAGDGDVVAHLFGIEMGDLIHPKVAREIMGDVACGVGVSQKGEPNSVALDDASGVCLIEGFAHTCRGNPLLAYQVAAVPGACGLPIPRVIVGERENIEAGVLKSRDTARIDAESNSRLGKRRLGTERTFKVSESDVGGEESLRKRLEGNLPIVLFGHQRAEAAGEQDVSDGNEGRATRSPQRQFGIDDGWQPNQVTRHGKEAQQE